VWVSWIVDADVRGKEEEVSGWLFDVVGLAVGKDDVALWLKWMLDERYLPAAEELSYSLFKLGNSRETELGREEKLEEFVPCDLEMRVNSCTSKEAIVSSFCLDLI